MIDRVNSQTILNVTDEETFPIMEINFRRKYAFYLLKT